MQKFNETAHQILDIAEEYTQTVGPNHFSYRDIQRIVGIKTSSIHYHFATKEQLFISMLERYSERYFQHLSDIEFDISDASTKLRNLGLLFVETAKKNKFCLCGALMIELRSMSDDIEQQLQIFFDKNINWISRIIESGIKAKQIKQSINPILIANSYFALLEGGLLTVKKQKSAQYFIKTIDEFLKLLDK